jgi:hypothetical protein
VLVFSPPLLPQIPRTRWGRDKGVTSMEGGRIPPSTLLTSGRYGYLRSPVAYYHYHTYENLGAVRIADLKCMIRGWPCLGDQYTR